MVKRSTNTVLLPRLDYKHAGLDSGGIWEGNAYPKAFTKCLPESFPDRMLELKEARTITLGTASEKVNQQLIGGSPLT